MLAVEPGRQKLRCARFLREGPEFACLLKRDLENGRAGWLKALDLTLPIIK
jgi:hypothetical protein